MTGTMIRAPEFVVSSPFRVNSEFVSITSPPFSLPLMPQLSTCEQHDSYSIRPLWYSIYNPSITVFTVASLELVSRCNLLFPKKTDDLFVSHRPLRHISRKRQLGVSEIIGEGLPFPLSHSLSFPLPSFSSLPFPSPSPLFYPLPSL